MTTMRYSLEWWYHLGARRYIRLGTPDQCRTLTEMPHGTYEKVGIGRN